MMRQLCALATLVALTCSTYAEICYSDICEFKLRVSRGRTMTIVDSELHSEDLILHNDQLHLTGWGQADARPIEDIDFNDVSLQSKRGSWQVITGDGYRRNLILINGQFPGPTLQVRHGSQVVVHVINRLVTSAVTVHWHGIIQKGTTWMDGVAYVTQCPIPPGQTFTYRFLATPVGTHWYHSHLGNQRQDGLSGQLIVHKGEPRLPWFPLQVSDWFHVEADEHALPNMETSLDRPLPLLSSSLINGRGRFKNKAPLSIFRVKNRMKYRFRCVNTGADHTYLMSVDHHQLEIVALDGHGINSLVVDAFFMAPGERVDFIILADQPGGRYWLRGRTVKPPGPRIKHGDHSHTHPDQQLGVTHGRPEDSNNHLRNHTAEEPLSDVDQRGPHTNHTTAFTTLNQVPARTTEGPQPNGHGLMPTNERAGRHHQQNTTHGQHTDHLSIHSMENRQPDHHESEHHQTPPEGQPTISSEHDTNVDALAIIAYDTFHSGADPTSEPIPCTASKQCIIFNCPFSYPKGDFIKCLLVSQATSNTESHLQDEHVIEHMLNVGLNWGSSINSRRFVLPKAPLYDVDPRTVPCEGQCNRKGEGCGCTHSISLPYNRTVQFVVSNIEPKSHHDHSKHLQQVAGHPVHIHGHTFAVVAQGLATYDPETGAKIHDSKAIACENTFCKSPHWSSDAKRNINLTSPPFKDTILVPPGGYVVLRFRSENPGFWLLHCHILSDQSNGMSLVLKESTDRVMAPPAALPRCSQFTWSQNEFNKYLGDSIKYKGPVRFQSEKDIACGRNEAGTMLRVTVTSAIFACLGSLGLGVFIGILPSLFCKVCRHRRKKFYLEQTASG